MFAVVPGLSRRAVQSDIPTMRWLFSIVLVMALTSCGHAQSDAVFQYSGVIEGFYGPPWSHDDRLDMLRFMGSVGLGSYYYAPKDDPYHRTRWREPYPPDRLERLSALVATATDHGVEFVFAISPGGSMVYSDSADRRMLYRKLDQLSTVGVRHFALFVDDVLYRLAHDRDRRQYADLAEAHASLIVAVRDYLDASGATLSVTPTTYTGAWGDRTYLERLGGLVPADVPFFWTGVDVASPTITAEQAASWRRLMARPPLVWDNYPVNDFARWRPFLGPVRGRTSDLPFETMGILSNPMTEAHASMIPLATLAEYVRDPRGYDPDRALRRALADLYGPSADLLEPFVRIYGDYPWDTNLFEPLFIPGTPIDRAAVETGLTELRQALARLDAGAGATPGMAPLVAELSPFVTRTAERLAEIERDPAYEIRDGMLRYRTERDRVAVPSMGSPPTVDGQTADWPRSAWRPTHGQAGDGRPPRVALGTHGDMLYIAVDVPGRSDTEAGNRIGERDHVALILQHEPGRRRNSLEPDDLLLLLAPTTGTGHTEWIGGLGVHGFMAKFLADNRNLTWSEFLLTSLGRADTTDVGYAVSIRRAVAKTRGGYVVEIAIPVTDVPAVRLSLTVARRGTDGRDFSSLSRRNFPANPATYAELILASRP
jgi:hypothetical protein